MRRILKRVASLFLVPLTRWYLKSERTYTYEAVTVSVLPGVFHPGLFSSTKLILGYVKGRIMPGQTVLEVGSGSGLISVVAAKAGAEVTALDISKTAIENTRKNAALNNVSVTTIQSDLFKDLTQKTFEWIIINPPYYAADPKNESDFAWYCGKDFEYFNNLFKGLPEFSVTDTKIIMVLTKGCDVEKISGIGNRAGFRFELLKQKSVVFDEKDMLFQLHFSN